MSWIDMSYTKHQYSQHSTRCVTENEPKCNINIPCTCIGHAGSSVGEHVNIQ